MAEALSLLDAWIPLHSAIGARYYLSGSFPALNRAFCRVNQIFLPIPASSDFGYDTSGFHTANLGTATAARQGYSGPGMARWLADLAYFSYQILSSYYVMINRTEGCVQVFPVNIRIICLKL